MTFWHMSLAGIIEAWYDGNNPNVEIPGVNVRKARYSKNTGFNFFTLGRANNRWSYCSGNSVYEKVNVIIIAFGSLMHTDSSFLANSALSPRNAYHIDNKLDDGLGYTGKVMSDHGSDVGNNDQCLDYGSETGQFAHNYVSATNGDIPYVLTTTSPKCRMMFEI